MKKMVCLLLTLVMVLTMTSGALAEPGVTIEPTTENVDIITIKDCIASGEAWIEVSYGNDGTEVSGVIPVKNLYGEVNGYCINFIKDDKPNGYMIINADANAKATVREFALSGNWIYDQLVENSGLTAMGMDTALYTTSPFNYAIKSTGLGETQVYTTQGEKMTLSSAQTVYATSANIFAPRTTEAMLNNNGHDIYDGVFHASHINSYTVSSEKVTSPWVEYFSPEITSHFYNPNGVDEYNRGPNAGNCGPVAALNLCLYYYNCENATGRWNVLLVDPTTSDDGTEGEYENNVKHTYKALVPATGFDPTIVNWGPNDGVSYTALIGGISNYFDSRYYPIDFDHFNVFNSPWSSFETAIDAGDPVITFIEPSDGSGGHFVISMGYKKMTNGNKYLRVADGWMTTTHRYLIWDSDYYVKYRGSRVIPQ